MIPWTDIAISWMDSRNLAINPKGTHGAVSIECVQSAITATAAKAHTQKESRWRWI